MSRSVIHLLFFFGLTAADAQRLPPQADSLLIMISRMQSPGDEFYDKGLFPSKRFGGTDKGRKEDNTIFFTALIAFTLQSIYPSFSGESQKVADTIIDRARGSYVHYKNRNGDITYNFWQTDPDQHFPNNRYSSHKRFKLPDDMDDTSIIYLTQKQEKKRDSLLRNKMVHHTNLYNNRKIHSTYKRYRKFKAYNTWFSKGMDLEFDICVMSNVLVFASDRGQPFNQYDNQTVALIIEMVKNDDHLKNPFIISPSYQNSAIILYHLARLLNAAPSQLFNGIRTKVVSDIRNCLNASHNKMEQIILLSSLYRLNEPVTFQLDFNGMEKDMEAFAFFHGNLLATSPLWIKKLLKGADRFNFHYQCEAYYRTLVLEYLSLKD